jgi:hypothetical protein
MHLFSFEAKRYERYHFPMDGLIAKAAGYLAANMRTLKDAPLVFVVAVWAAFLGAYLLVDWRYTGILEQRGAAIETLSAQFKVAERSAAELREKLAAASQTAVERDPDGVFQFGRQVGAVQQPRIDEAAGMALFAAITGATNLNVQRDIEYRNLVLHIRTVGLENQATVGGQASRALQFVTCDIVDRVQTP